MHIQETLLKFRWINSFQSYNKSNLFEISKNFIFASNFTMVSTTSKKNVFITKFKENGDFNQYWYSPATIDYLVGEIMEQGKKVAFLSTPSVYFSIKDKEFKENCFLFEVTVAILLLIHDFAILSTIKGSQRTRTSSSMILKNLRISLLTCSAPLTSC